MLHGDTSAIRFVMETRYHARSTQNSGLQATPLAPTSQAGSSVLATTLRRRLLPPTPEPDRPPNFPPPAPLKVRESLAHSWRDWRQQSTAYLTVMRLHDQQEDLYSIWFSISYRISFHTVFHSVFHFMLYSIFILYSILLGFSFHSVFHLIRFSFIRFRISAGLNFVRSEL